MTAVLIEAERRVVAARGEETGGWPYMASSTLTIT